jgi:hypothetical protein
MLDFNGLHSYAPDAALIVPHIYPLTNISLTQLQRGKLTEYTIDTPAGPIYDYDYLPPPLELYTQFSLQTYFFAFWGILILQSCTILVIDKIWVKNIPNTATLWDRILHSVQKASFPFPYTNWHQENGSCSDHLRRKQMAQQEVLVSILINLIFNMILLIPLPIFCEI